VADQKAYAAVLLERVDQAPTSLLIDVVGRLVEGQDIGLLPEGDSNLSPLPLAVAENVPLPATV